MLHFERYPLLINVLLREGMKKRRKKGGREEGREGDRKRKRIRDRQIDRAGKGGTIFCISSSLSTHRGREVSRHQNPSDTERYICCCWELDSKLEEQTSRNLD